MAWLTKSLQHVTRAAALVGGIGIMLLLVCVQVFARYVLHKPMGWVIPVVEYSVVMLTFLAIAWLEQRDRHIRIEILVDGLGRRTRLALQRTTALLAPLISLVFVLVGFRVVYDLAARGIFTEDLLEIPLAPPVHRTEACYSPCSAVSALVNEPDIRGEKSDIPGCIVPWLASVQSRGERLSRRVNWPTTQCGQARPRQLPAGVHTL